MMQSWAGLSESRQCGNHQGKGDSEWDPEAGPDSGVVKAKPSLLWSFFFYLPFFGVFFFFFDQWKICLN